MQKEFQLRVLPEVAANKEKLQDFISPRKTFPGRIFII